MRLPFDCPACDQATLVASPTRVVCVNDSCQNKDAASQLLGSGAPKTTDHILKVNAQTGEYTCLHPLIERLNQELFNCDVNAMVDEVFNYLEESGKYLVRQTPDGFEVEKLS